jgi:hypothetical protein
MNAALLTFEVKARLFEQDQRRAINKATTEAADPMEKSKACAAKNDRKQAEMHFQLAKVRQSHAERLQAAILSAEFSRGELEMAASSTRNAEFQLATHAALAAVNRAMPVRAIKNVADRTTEVRDALADKQVEIHDINAESIDVGMANAAVYQSDDGDDFDTFFETHQNEKTDATANAAVLGIASPPTGFGPPERKRTPQTADADMSPLQRFLDEHREAERASFKK